MRRQVLRVSSASQGHLLGDSVSRGYSSIYILDRNREYKSDALNSSVLRFRSVYRVTGGLEISVGRRFAHMQRDAVLESQLSAGSSSNPVANEQVVAVNVAPQVVSVPIAVGNAAPELQQSAVNAGVLLTVSSTNLFAEVTTPVSHVPANPSTSTAISTDIKYGRLKRAWVWLVEGAKHYWLGTKLLYFNTAAAIGHVRKLTRGEKLTRRERRNLTRTTADLFRLVPFMVFVIVPFLEFTLPLFLKLFPNMLPSTFEDKHQKEEKLKRNLKLKLDVAKFLHETLTNMKDRIEDPDLHDRYADFLLRVNSGQDVTDRELEEFSRLFEDDFTLDNLSRPQLTSICRFLSLRPYGTDAFLRWQISNRLRALKADDEEIVREGIKKLTFEELQQICIARGMRGYGISKEALRVQLSGWLDMSLNKRVPGIILILSRIMMISTNVVPEVALRETLSALPEEVLDQAALRADEISGKTDMQLKLDVLRNELDQIQDEQAVHTLTEKEVESLEKSIEKDFASARANLLEITEALAALASSSAVSKEREEYEELRKSWTLYQEKKIAEQKLSKTRSAEAAAASAAAAAAAVAAAVATPGAVTQTLASTPESTTVRIALEGATPVDVTVKTSSSVPRPPSLEAEVFMRPAELKSIDSMSVLTPKPPVTAATAPVPGGRVPPAVPVSATEPANAAMAAAKAAAAADAALRKKLAAANDSLAGERLERRFSLLMRALEDELQDVDRTVGDRLKLIDRDEDGRISLEEVTTAMSHLKDKPTVDEMREVLRVCDPDNDGVLFVRDIEKVKSRLAELNKADEKV